jgi:peroxiredoxin
MNSLRRRQFLAGLVVVIVLGAILTAVLGGRTGGGRRAASFEAVDLLDHELSVSPGEGHSTLLLFLCQCDRCRRLASHLRQISRLQMPDAPQVIGILRAGRDEAAIFQKSTQFPGILLLDSTGEIHDQYGAGRCPNAWFVNMGGSVYSSRNQPTELRMLEAELASWLDWK